MIEAQGLGKRFGSTWAVRDCSFAIPARSVCALVGGNGAGKTTLLRMLAGLAKPTTGEARLAQYLAQDAASVRSRDRSDKGEVRSPGNRACKLGTRPTSCARRRCCEPQAVCWSLRASTPSAHRSFRRAPC